MCLAMFFFKLVASTNYSPDDQNKTMPGPDKEVKKQKKTAFTSFVNLSMTLSLAAH